MHATSEIYAAYLSDRDVSKRRNLLRSAQRRQFGRPLARQNGPQRRLLCCVIGICPKPTSHTRSSRGATRCSKRRVLVPLRCLTVVLMNQRDGADQSAIALRTAIWLHQHQQQQPAGPGETPYRDGLQLSSAITTSHTLHRHSGTSGCRHPSLVDWTNPHERSLRFCFGQDRKANSGGGEASIGVAASCAVAAAWGTFNRR